MLEQAKPTKTMTPFRMVIHGGPKVGKSTFAAGAPKPIFICTEDGLSGIDTTALPLCTSYQMVKDQLEAVLDEKHDFKTLVIDSADWLEKLIVEKVLSDYKTNRMSDAAGGYGKGYEVMNYLWAEILGYLKRINIEKKMLIVVICHSRTVQFMDPMGEMFDQFKMKLHAPKSGAGAADFLTEWADIIGFCWAETFTKKTADGKKNTSIPTGDRVLFLDSTGSFLAGNRYGLPGQMPLTFSSLIDAYKAIMTTTAKEIK